MVVPRSTSWFSALLVRSTRRDVLARGPGRGHDAQLREEQGTVLDVERAAQLGRVDLGRRGRASGARPPCAPAMRAAPGA